MDARYILGIAELDSQHLEIEETFLKLQIALDDKKHWGNLRAILDELSERLRFHFHAEEAIMQLIAYPETQDHQKSHREVLKALDCPGGDCNRPEFIEHLKRQPMQLFFDQILSQDRRFAGFLQTHRDRLGFALTEGIAVTEQDPT